MFVWDRGGGDPALRDRRAARSGAPGRRRSSSCFPGEPIKVRGNGKFVVLSGTVSSKEVADAQSTWPPASSRRRKRSSPCCRCSRAPPTPSGAAARALRRSQPHRDDRVRAVAVHEPDGHQQHPRPCHHAAVLGARVHRPRMVEGQQRVRRAGDERRRQVQLQRLPELLRPQRAVRPRRDDSCDAAARPLPEPRRTEPRGGERQGSELPRRRRVSGSGRDRVPARTWRSRCSSRNSASA